MATQVLIENGLLFSGTSPNEKADIRNLLIEDGRIKSISADTIDVEPDTEVIDAAGKWITPGFVDSHTHYDAELIASPGLKESARHGVTTILLGSCSVSAVYNTPEDTSDTFTRVEAIPREVMLPLLEREKTWNTPKEWLDYIDDLPLGVNVASFIGHSDLRSRAMGMQRSLSHDEAASPAEQQQMSEMLNDALDAGFLGMSTMDNPWDKMDGDKYWSHKTPSFYGSWKERKPLLKILRERNAILQGAPNLVTRVSALRYMAVSTGIFRKPLKTTMIAMMDLIADRMIMPLVATGARAFNRLCKADFRMQTPPTPFTVYYDGVDSVMFEEFPAGEAMRHLAKSLDERNAMIQDPKFRSDFKAEIKKKFAPKVWHRDLSLTVILECPEQTVVGKNFMQVAEERKQHPVDAFLDLIVEYDKQIRWTSTIANDRKDMYRMLYNYPYNLISFSDAGAHLRNMAFYDFPLQMIRNVQDSIDAGSPFMSMEKCIWRLTGEQSDWFGLECGKIQEGQPADLNIIDPHYLTNVTEEVTEAPVEEFDNYPRLVNRHPGVVSRVFVGGETIYQDEEFAAGYGTDRRFGRFLKSLQTSEQKTPVRERAEEVAMAR